MVQQHNWWSLWVNTSLWLVNNGRGYMKWMAINIMLRSPWKQASGRKLWTLPPPAALSSTITYSDNYTNLWPKEGRQCNRRTSGQQSFSYCKRWNGRRCSRSSEPRETKRRPQNRHRHNNCWHKNFRNIKNKIYNMLSDSHFKSNTISVPTLNSKLVFNW